MTAEAAIIADEVASRIEKVMSNSPWRDRRGAASYCSCSTKHIDRARACGFIPNRSSEFMPRFLTADLDAWIRAGMPTTPDRAKMELIKHLNSKRTTSLAV